MLGAAAGYGVGALGEKLLPERWERGKLRRTLAGMGGFAGAAPGLLNMAANHSQGKPLLNSDLWDYSPPNIPQKMGCVGEGEDGKIGDGTHALQPIQSVRANAFAKLSEALDSDDELDLRLKQAISMPGYGLADPLLPVTDFSETVWGDPRVSGRLSVPVRAAATGLVESAYHARGGGARLVSPMDIGRITAGIGTGRFVLCCPGTCGCGFGPT